MRAGRPRSLILLPSKERGHLARRSQDPPVHTANQNTKKTSVVSCRQCTGEDAYAPRMRSTAKDAYTPRNFTLNCR